MAEAWQRYVDVLMSYVVLARKWRPQTFEDLVGQEHVSRTLANAIQRDRVAHAFLFTGVRGVGKTTCARILAKALNCEKGPTPTPCLSCLACTEIGAGTDVDVCEIDGASYNGIDEVRKLQESIPYQPTRDRFKIFIVDEVHMLSNAAWNAFLKTLEEPPPHVKFMFATTEVHKVPVTILSRCQRYDFKLIRSEEIIERLRHVLDAEKVEAEDEAVRIVAREAAGSMRDAMSLLDQLLAWVGGSSEPLTGDAVARVLGVAARSVLHRLGEALVDGEASSCLDIVANLAEQGYPLLNVARDFLEHLRDLVVAKVSAHPKRLVQLADAELSDLMALAKRSEADDLSRIFLGFSRAYDDIARSAQPRAAFEMTLVRLARRPALLPMDELLRKLAELERRLNGGAATGRAAGGRESRALKSAPSASAPSASAPSPSAPSASAPSASAPSASAPSRPASSPARAGAAPPEGRRATAKEAKSPAAKGGGRPAPKFEAPAAPKSPAKPPVSPKRDPRPKRDALSDEGMSIWADILARVGMKKASIASIFQHAAPLQIEPGCIVLAYETGQFVGEQAMRDEAKQLLAEVATDKFGVETTVSFDLSGRHAEVETVAEKLTAKEKARLAAARKRIAEDPVVTATVEIFSAELREVRLPEDGR